MTRGCQAACCKVGVGGWWWWGVWGCVCGCVCGWWWCGVGWWWWWGGGGGGGGWWCVGGGGWVGGRRRGGMSEICFMEDTAQQGLPRAGRQAGVKRLGGMRANRQQQQLLRTHLRPASAAARRLLGVPTHVELGSAHPADPNSPFSRCICSLLWKLPRDAVEAGPDAARPDDVRPTSAAGPEGAVAGPPPPLPPPAWAPAPAPALPAALVLLSKRCSSSERST